MSTLPKTVILYNEATTDIKSDFAFTPGANTGSTNNTRSILKVRGTIGGATIKLQIKWTLDGVFTDTDDVITIPMAKELNYSPGTILQLNMTGITTTDIDAEVENAVEISNS